MQFFGRAAAQERVGRLTIEVIEGEQVLYTVPAGIRPFTQVADLQGLATHFTERQNADLKSIADFEAGRLRQAGQTARPSPAA